jgi:hypothetical protein
MSGLFKSIGKIFKKVGKILKKIALPALAIAAVVVTGGAALGLLPGIAGLGGLAASLGASPLIAGVLSAAGTGATLGAITGFVTTGKLSGAISGASTGFLAGAVTGGIGAALGGGGGAASAALQPGASAAADGASSTFDSIVGGAGATGSIGQAASGIGGAVGSGLGEGVIAAAPAAASGAASAGGGILGFLGRNPLIASGVLKGIGGALQGDPTTNAMKMRQGNYNINGPVYRPYDPSVSPGDQPANGFNQVIYGNGQYEYDPNSGRILPKAGG